MTYWKRKNYSDILKKSVVRSWTEGKQAQHRGFLGHVRVRVRVHSRSGMIDCVTHALYPSRRLCPWDFPGKHP